MANSGDIVRKFYDAAIRRDLAEARRYVDDGLEFEGLFETYHGAEEYMASFTKLLGITTRLDVKKIICEGGDAAVFFELVTKAPAEATTFVAEWHQVKNGKISHVRSAFDGRPFEAMFAGTRRT